MSKKLTCLLFSCAVGCCLLLIPPSGLAQQQFIQGRNGVLHHTLTVFDFDDVPVTWNMKGEIQAFLNEGINTMNEGNTEDAIGQFSEAIKRDESLWIARYYRAMCYKRTNRLNEALLDLLEADAVNNNQYEVKIELGKVFIIKKEPESAERFLRAAIKLKPKEVHGYYFLGLIQLMENSIPNALEQFKKCEELQPKFPDAKIQIALLLMQQGSGIEEVIALLSKSIEVDSMQADARQTRFLILLQEQRDLSRALEDVNFLLTYNQFHLGWRMARAYLLIQYNNFDAAFQDIKRVLDASSMNQDYFMWRHRLEHSIDIQNAGRYLVSRIYGLSDKNQLIIKKAFCQIVIGKYEQALSTLATSPQSDSHPAFLYLKGLANELMGYWQDAQPFYNRALARDNDIFDLHRKRGNFHVNRQEWGKAEDDFDVMQRLYPDVITTYRVRGIARFYNKKYKEALEDLNRYLKVDSTHLECIAYRGRCYQEMGQMFPAIRDLAKGLEFDWIDFDRANRVIDSLVWTEDSVRLVQFTSYFSVFRPFPVRNSRAEILELKLMWLGKKWAEIESKWNEFGNTRVVKDDKKFGSFLFTVRAVSFIEKKYSSEALQMLTEALSFDHNNSYAYYERGKLFLQLKEATKAREDFLKASKLGDTRANKYLGKAD